MDQITDTQKIGHSRAAAINLEADGTIRIEGERIVETATQDITLAAGWIDLN